MIAVERWLEPFWAGMTAHLWQSLLFLAGVAVVAWLLRRASSRVVVALYWIGVLKLLLPLPLLGPIGERLMPALARFAPALSHAPDTGWFAVTVWIYPIAQHSATAVRLPPGLISGLTALWLVGLWIMIRRMIVGYRPERDDQNHLIHLSVVERDRLTRGLAATGIPAQQVRLSELDSSPAVHGALRTVIRIPAPLVRGLDTEELIAVLVHEREHMRRRDPLRFALLEIVRAAFWFYPPVWWLARRIREATELACDEAVVRDGVSPATYCRSLARAVQLGLTGTLRGAPTGMLGDRGSRLRLRLDRIRSPRRYDTMFSHRVFLAAALLAAVAVSFMPLSPTANALQAGTPPTSPDWSRLEAADRAVDLDYRKTELSEILAELAGASGVSLNIIGRLPGESIELTLGRTTLRDALERLAITSRLRFTVTGPRSIDVHAIRLAGKSGVTTPKRLTESSVRPEYPESARLEKLEGRVILQAVIRRDGTVGEIDVLSCTPDGHQPFIDSAVDAVSQWRYQPALQDGEPVDVYFTIRVEFALGDKPRDESGPAT